MRQRTMETYAARIDRAVKLIEQTEPGDEPPSLTALADAAALSPFHFHRVFRLMTGETVGAMSQRLRLVRSLDKLADTTVSVTEAAAGSGYATSQGFARAMRQVAGASATEVRGDPVAAAQITEALRGARTGNAPLAIEVVSLEPFRVAALRRTGAYEDLDDGYDALFGAVFAHIEMAALRGIWGVPLDDPFTVPAAQRRFDCALDLGGEPVDAAGVETIELGGLTALRLMHIGSFDAVHAALDGLYEAALAAPGLELGAPPLIHYLDQPEDRPEEALRAQLYLPVELS